MNHSNFATVEKNEVKPINSHLSLFGCKNIKMNLNKIIKSTALFAIAVCTTISMQAQNNRHASMHEDYIAGIGNNANKIKNEETNKFVNGVLGNETEEVSISEIDEQYGWDSPRVNCYDGVEIPAIAKIDVRGFYMPVSGEVTSGYGYRPRFRRMHRGIDLNLNTGDTVRAAFNGRVRIVNYEARGYGKYVVIRHDNGLETVYGHFSKHLVERNQFVKAGEPIGLGGNTGRSFGAHLHFETRYLGVAINPAAIIDFENATVHSDVFTFNKTTYQNSRNYSPAAAQKAYAKKSYKSKANKKSKKYSKSKSKSKKSVASKNSKSKRYKSKATANAKSKSKSRSKKKS